jgi:hypothetical protein
MLMMNKRDPKKLASIIIELGEGESHQPDEINPAAMMAAEAAMEAISKKDVRTFLMALKDALELVEDKE